MPTYEYACTTCGKEFELFQSMKDDALKTCNCGQNGVVRRKIGRGAGLIFKGTGFYETDYKRKSGSGGESSSSSGSNESKPTAKTESSPSAPATPPASPPASS
jgi:putative FmdB family regulatory protein